MFKPPPPFIIPTPLTSSQGGVHKQCSAPSIADMSQKLVDGSILYCIR